MSSQNDQSVDSVFGQTPAFSLTDPGVDPAVIQYLSGVRQEALRTNVIKVTPAKRHTADIYDDDDEVIVKKPRVEEDLTPPPKYVDSHLTAALRWFESVKHLAVTNKPIHQNHTEESLNLLLHFLRDYLRGLKTVDKQASHLLNVLKDLPPIEENDDYELDEEWAESVVKRLRNRRISSVADVKSVINDTSSSKPVGFKQWYQYLQRTEPTQSAFSSTIDVRNIWVLVQYMTQEWIKNISKGKKPTQAARFAQWLLFILLNIPDNLTAEYTSNLRNLGKKCRRAIKEAYGGKETIASERITPPLACPRELTELNVPPMPEDLDIIQLTLAVIAVKYRQRDLIDWTMKDDQP